MGLNEIKSPCTNVCRLNAQEICIGCGRHIEEIIAWSAATDARRRAIVEVARQRLSIIAGTTSQPVADDPSETQ